MNTSIPPKRAFLFSFKVTAAVAAAVLAMGGLSPVLAGGEGWTANYEQAKTQAVEGKKDLLMDFTGSDWCGWCIKLKKEVFDHDAFRNGVKDSFVLVELDFPRDKSKLSEETQTQNAALQKQFNIQGYPTILLCDASGKPYARTGYQKGGPEKYVEHLNELRKRKAVRDEAFAKAESAAGVERAKQLVAALEALELDGGAAAQSYPEIVEKIKSADPGDQTGYAAKQAAGLRMAEFKEKLTGFMKAKDMDGAAGYIDSVIADTSWPLDFRQDAHGHKASLQVQNGKLEEAGRTLEAGVALAPGSDTAGKLKQFHEFVKKRQEAAPAPKEEEKPKEADAEKAAASGDGAGKKEAGGAEPGEKAK